jgi:hypothetical protein
VPPIRASCRRRRLGRYLLFDTHYNWKCQMSIDAEVLNSESVDMLCGMYATEYTSQSLVRMRDPVPSMLNALGACAGFAAQVAVWRTLVLPTGRNPGDFFVYVGNRTKSYSTVRRSTSSSFRHRLIACRS